MDHQITSYLDDKLKIHVNNLITNLNFVSRDIKFTGDKMEKSIDKLSTVIDSNSKSSDRQATRIYWLTWILALASVLNAIGVLLQVCYK